MHTPDITNTRTRQRIRRALVFAESRFGTAAARAWASRDIDRYFTQQQNPISRWLRQQLLIESSGYYNSNTGQCKEYLLNADGVAQLKLLLGINNQEHILPELKQEFHKELTTLEFDYHDKSHRLWNPIQNIRREFKQQLLADAGLKYTYDIEAAAPTLISQLARYRGFTGSTPRIEEYLRDKQAIREQLSLQTGVSVKAIKQVINAMFCGARISHWTRGSIFLICDENHYVIDQLKQNSWIMELKEEIRGLWTEIFKNERQRDLDGRLKRITSRDRWTVYFELERQVLEVTKRYLKKKQVRCFLEHDGFTTEQAINLMELEDRIRQETGFLVRLSVLITH